MWYTSHPLIAPAMLAAALFAAYQSIRTSWTPQGAAAWVIFILAVPPVAIPLYAVFGYANYGQAAARRKASHEALPDYTPRARRSGDGSRLARFEALAGRPAEEGNAVELLTDGEEMFETMIAAIGEAEEYIFAEFYAIISDPVGRRFLSALLDRARAGVDVNLLHDAYSGVGLPDDLVLALRAAGAHVDVPNAPRRHLGRFQINFRSHRKLIVIDGRVGFTGGFNIGEKYLGRDPSIGPWRDTFVRLRGPMLAQLQRVFEEDWHASTGEDVSRRRPAPQIEEGGMRGLILAPGPTDPVRSGNLYFVALAWAARRRLWITSPYLAPDNEVLSALRFAAMRGVEVRVLIPDRADHWVPWIAAFAYIDELMSVGAEIWRYKPGFAHQKVALVDDDIVSVGSINLDIRSGLLNFEQTAIVEDARFAAEAEAMLRRDFARSERMERRLSERSLWLRVGARAAKLTAPVL